MIACELVTKVFEARRHPPDGDATPHAGRAEVHAPGSEHGFALVLIVAMLLPALLLVTAFGSVLTSRSDELQLERGRERALQAAESGIDLAMYRGRRALLHHEDVYQEALGSGSSFRVEVTHLLVDGLDNDGDGVPDDADEDVFQVVVVGQYRNLTRRLAAYLGPVPLFPDIRTAFGVANPAANLMIGGSALVNGNDVSGVHDSPGMSIFLPGTTADLLATLSAGEQGRIDGLGGTPSLGTMAAFDIDEVVTVVQNTADLVLPGAFYSGLQFGDAATNDARITYRHGNLRMTGTSRGAGVLVVTGNFEVQGNFEFDGLILVLGDVVNSSGSALIRGAIVQGPTGGSVDLRGNFELQYSSSALDLANASAGVYVAFNGWQELHK